MAWTCFSARISANTTLISTRECGFGQAGIGGHDRNYFTTFDYGHPLPGKWGYAAEVAEFSRASASTPANMVILLTATYSPSPRLILDIGEYTAVYGNLPRVTFFMGVTYAIADSRPSPPHEPGTEPGLEPGSHPTDEQKTVANGYRFEEADSMTVAVWFRPDPRVAQGRVAFRSGIRRAGDQLQSFRQ